MSGASVSAKQSQSGWNWCCFNAPWHSETEYKELISKVKLLQLLPTSHWLWVAARAALKPRDEASKRFFTSFKPTGIKQHRRLTTLIKETRRVSEHGGKRCCLSALIPISKHKFPCCQCALSRFEANSAYSPVTSFPPGLRKPMWTLPRM